MNSINWDYYFYTFSSSWFFHDDINCLLFYNFIVKNNFSIFFTMIKQIISQNKISKICMVAPCPRATTPTLTLIKPEGRLVRSSWTKRLFYWKIIDILRTSRLVSLFHSIIRMINVSLILKISKKKSTFFHKVSILLLNSLINKKKQ